MTILYYLEELPMYLYSLALSHGSLSGTLTEAQRCSR